MLEVLARRIVLNVEQNKWLSEGYMFCDIPNVEEAKALWLLVALHLYQVNSRFY